MREERIDNSTGYSDGEDEAYTKSRRLWKLYLKGKLTAEQLGESLGGLGEDTKGEIGDLYGKECK